MSLEAARMNLHGKRKTSALTQTDNFTHFPQVSISNWVTWERQKSYDLVICCALSFPSSQRWVYVPPSQPQPQPRPESTPSNHIHIRLISWWIILLEWRKSSPFRMCFVTQMISNSLIGPQLSSFSMTDPPSPASIKRWIVSSHKIAPYNSAMFSCRKHACISTSEGLNCSTGT